MKEEQKELSYFFWGRNVPLNKRTWRAKKDVDSNHKVTKEEVDDLFNKMYNTFQPFKDLVDYDRFRRKEYMKNYNEKKRKECMLKQKIRPIGNVGDKA